MKIRIGFPQKRITSTEQSSANQKSDSEDKQGEEYCNEITKMYKLTKK